jgi:hypothetical protein
MIRLASREISLPSPPPDGVRRTVFLINLTLFQKKNYEAKNLVSTRGELGTHSEKSLKRVVDRTNHISTEGLFLWSVLKCLRQPNLLLILSTLVCISGSVSLFCVSVLLLVSTFRACAFVLHNRTEFRTTQSDTHK